MNQMQIKLPLTSDGQPVLPAVDRTAEGKPRFHIPLVKELIQNDPGVRYLVVYETTYGGYEACSRKFFDEHLQPGDLFIDVGAHWGCFAFSAATRWPGQVRVLAIEAHPLNVLQLLKGVGLNKLSSTVEVVAAAAGNETGSAVLRCNSTMGNSLDEATPATPQVPLRVPVVTIDTVLASRPEYQQGRVFLKVDVEGFELEVLQGAKGLMESGRVAAVMWEKGNSYDRDPGRGKMLRLIEEFKRLGFSLHRFPSSEFSGPLVPFAPTPEVGNVFALAPGFSKLPVYTTPFEPRPPFNSLFATPGDPATRAETTRLLMEVRSSDGARWANPIELADELAEARATVAASMIRPDSRVLDLGAGLMSLRKHLPAGCDYQPADLLARSANCLVLDLNQGQFPADKFDAICLLEVIEYLHDVPWLLARCRQAATRLICAYPVYTEETLLQRRERGWFNDFTAHQFTAMLKQAGWTIEREQSLERLFVVACQ